MCLAVPGRIVELRGDTAVVELQGNRLEVSSVLTPDAVVGEWVLVHAGFAITRIDERDARETWGYLNEIEAMAPTEAAGTGEGDRG